jgi:hypothetical protein
MPRACKKIRGGRSPTRCVRFSPVWAWGVISGIPDRIALDSLARVEHRLELSYPSDGLLTHPISSGENTVLRIVKSPYFIAGIIIFLILFGVLLFGVKATLGESLLASAALTAIGVGVLVWKEYVG